MKTIPISYSTKNGVFYERFLFFFSIRVFFQRLPLYHFQPLTNIQRFFATLHMRWLLRAFNRNACVYQAATRWDLPPSRIPIWLVDWWCNVCLFTWWFDSRLLLQRFDIGNRWIWTCIGSPPYITRERLTKCGSHP